MPLWRPEPTKRQTVGSFVSSQVVGFAEAKYISRLFRPHTSLSYNWVDLFHLTGFRVDLFDQRHFVVVNLERLILKLSWLVTKPMGPTHRRDGKNHDQFPRDNSI